MYIIRITRVSMVGPSQPGHVYRSTKIHGFITIIPADGPFMIGTTPRTVVGVRERENRKLPRMSASEGRRGPSVSRRA